ncbi:MAG TPA: hypothetical protein VGG74_21155 [Kofleriaceae bacterium]
MSSRQVNYSQISCDGCGAVYDNIGRPVGVVRDLAAKDGWKFQRIAYEQSNWLRAVDLCPTCEEPKS